MGNYDMQDALFRQAGNNGCFLFVFQNNLFLIPMQAWFNRAAVCHVHETCAGILKRPGALSDGIFRDPSKIAGYVALPSQNWTRDIFIGALKEELSSEQRLLDGVRTVMLKRNRTNVIRFFHSFCLRCLRLLILYSELLQGCFRTLPLCRLTHAVSRHSWWSRKFSRTSLKNRTPDKVVYIPTTPICGLRRSLPIA